ncbi:hypothetical protein GCM10017779_50490 [Streptomyces capillispiralis]|uniref:Uncharacterized protein n=1 Tax=Streptomyces capillispiralis TaxID=68182 RepID=A0A561T7T5_9ACTN|nr:hypothetical protein [Streptomyces capillispiralis]TWF83171.1 hypothetical protein FHX78_1184 [Streptomyces capillispiralis]GHH94592.1 hypothetical protein GCM10017779_50490 [Streptomyces capillispiralis]
MDTIGTRVHLRRIRLPGTVPVGGRPRTGCARTPDGDGQPGGPDVRPGRPNPGAPLTGTSPDGDGGP